MNTTKPYLKTSRPILSFVSRSTFNQSHKTKQSSNEADATSTVGNNRPVNQRILSVPLQEISYESKSKTQTSVISATDINHRKSATNKVSSFNADKVSPLNSDEILNGRIIQQPSKSSNKFLKNLTPTQILVLKLISIFLIISGVAAVAIFTPIYMLIIRRVISESSFTNMTASICSTKTCMGKETPYSTSIVTALYPFDGNANELMTYTTGTLFGTSTPGFSGACYVGTQMLSLSATSFQYVVIPNVNLAQQSFTIEVWLYVANVPLSGELGIFSQCDSSSTCLVISIRNYHFSVSFDSMGTNSTLASASLIGTGFWIHLAVVYDATLYQQKIYINGDLDAFSSGIVASYQGTSTGQVTTIGRTTSSAYGTTYFWGRIDHFVISAGTARTACQIYNDATLIAYYPFESLDTFNDYSVNLFHGTAFGTTTISQGYSGKALNFSSNMSYFQAKCFAYLEVGNPPFSISIWVNPASIGSGGSIIHFSTLQNGSGTCFDLLVLTSTGEAVVQWMPSSTSINNTRGPVLRINTWTHIAIVFGSLNGMRVYVNGQLSATSLNTWTTGMTSYSSPQYLTFGNTSPLGSSAVLNCRFGTVPIVSGLFAGAIDEFRLFNRELSNQEVCVLANL